MIYIAAILGTLLFIAIQLKIEKQKADTDPKYHLRWKEYFQKEWDDFAFSLIIGLVLVFFQESIFFAYTEWKEMDVEKAIDFYVEAELAIAGFMGLFGSLLIMILFKYVTKKTSKISDDN
jgi:hypothetical protein